jgi:hypothetical protein
MKPQQRTQIFNLSQVVHKYGKYHPKSPGSFDRPDQLITIVPDSKIRNIPEVVLVRRWAVGVRGIWKGWDSWVKGGANGVSLQAT